MNRKDKAKEIYDRFFESTNLLLLLDWQRDDIAKQCALIHIQGLIDELRRDKLRRWRFDEDSERFIEIDEDTERINYWIDVQRELNKI